MLLTSSALSREERAMLEMIPTPISILAPLGDGMVVVARNACHVRFFADTPEPPALSEQGRRCLATGSEAVLEVRCVVAGAHRYVRFRLKPNSEGRIICVTEDLTARAASPPLEGEMRRLSVSDPLIGVMNQQQFMAAARRELRRVARHNSPLALVRIDLDRCQDARARVQDLRSVAAVLRAGTRDLDLIARIGDASLALLLVHTDGEHGRAVIERLRETISIRSAMAQTSAAPMTISAGVAEHCPGERLSDLLRRAETALCGAKAEGPNRVRLD